MTRFTKRGSDRQHEAIDIMTPRNTPIVAVEDGTIARLCERRAGGTTVYQFAPANQYVDYYAHLDHYPDGLKEEDVVRRANRSVRRAQVLVRRANAGR